jgi:hypothetical protein
MTWLSASASVVPWLLAPAVVVLLVAALLAFHEIVQRRVSWSGADHPRAAVPGTGRRASSDVLEEYLLDLDQAPARSWRHRRGEGVVANRASTALLWEHIAEREPAMLPVRARRRLPAPAAGPPPRDARPTRLIPLSA